MCRFLKNTNRTAYSQSDASRYMDCRAVIHEEQRVGTKRSRHQLNCGSFSFAERAEKIIIERMHERLPHFQPGRRVGNPFPYGGRRFRVTQFLSHDRRNEDFFG